MTTQAGPARAALESLRAELGEALHTDGPLLDAVRADQSGQVAAGRPLAVVEARDTADVQATLRFASSHGIPVVPRGAGTGLAGGAIGDEGEIVLSVLGMDRILEVSRDDELAVVQPGVINADLNAALVDVGLWWAPDPASRAISTVGGNIATNAGGLLCVKYGVTREAVLGLTVVLADGRVLELGRRTVKGVTGYDLTSLMIGSEGTLGVIVEATLKLRPLPTGTAVTVTGAFESIEHAARAASVVTASGVTPAILELLDPRAVQSIAAHLDLDLGDGALLLAQTDGAGASQEADSIAAIMRSLGGQVDHTEDADEARRLFDIRRAFHPSLTATGRTVLIEDVAVPRSALPAMFAAIERIERTYGFPIPTVAHAGDGNLHPNFVFEAARVDGHVEVPEHVWAAADELFLDCLRLGGTLTGEHGVGLLKKRWLRDEIGEDSFDLQRQIKSVFDPHGILNPGKVF